MTGAGNRKPLLANPEGILEDTLEKNTKRILEHEASDTHQELVKRLIEEANMNLEDLSALSQFQETPPNKVTNTVITIVLF